MSMNIILNPSLYLSLSRYNLVHNKEPDHEAVSRLILKQLRDQKLKFYVEGEVISPDVEIPADVWQDVSKFIYTGDALKINSSEVCLGGDGLE